MSLLWQLIRGKWVPPRDTHPSFKGSNVVVTGANIGLGFEAAVKFVQLGADKVVLAVRTLSKGEEAQQKIEQRTGRKGVLEVWHLDMLDYMSIKTFAERASRQLDHLDIAVLNAGIANWDYKESTYGYEQTMQVNVLSTTLLALLLGPKLRASKTNSYTPVLEIVGSSNHYMITKMNSEETPFASYNTAGAFNPMNQYSTSKLFVRYAEIALKRLANGSWSDSKGASETDPSFYVTVVCPGATQSDLARDASDKWFLRLPIWIFSTFFQRTTEEGARTYISGVTLGLKGHGRFWKDDIIME